MKKKKKGFTFVELLVITAIFAVLLTIAVVYYNQAKIGSRDTAAITAMNQLRLKAEMIYSIDRNYNNIKCDGNAEIVKICGDINEKLSPNTLTIVLSTPTGSGSGQYCAYAKLLRQKDGLDSYCCVDSAGGVKQTSINPGNIMDGQCRTNSTYLCPN